MEYRTRLIEKKLQSKLSSMGATVIVGPKWCGKTTTAEQYAKSRLYMQDVDQSERYKETANIRISNLLEGANPRLIDEWQEIPRLWDAIRYDIDRKNDVGLYILTGSTVADRSEIRHDGAGRIAEIRMRTMTLFEYGESTGEVSLSELFNKTVDVQGHSTHEFEGICDLIVKGGWPSTIGKSEKVAYEQMESYVDSVVKYSMSNIDGKKRDEKLSRAILKSLSRNTGSQVSVSTIMKDAEDHEGIHIHENTVYDYLEALDKLYICDNVEAWSTKLRSKTTIRTSKTRYLTDPAIAAFCLEASSKDLEFDLETLGFLFENMVIRDLKVYTESIGGSVGHYLDRNNVEVDAIVHLRNGKWGAIEIKLGYNQVESASKNLMKFKNSLDDTSKSRLAFMAVILPTGDAFTRSDGIHVIPIGCLRD